MCNSDMRYRVEGAIEKVMRAVSLVAIAPCAATLVFWVFLITVYVIGRRFFNLQWVFVEEFTGYIMVFITYFSWIYVLRKGGHIGVTFVFDRLSKKAKSTLGLVTSFLALVLVCYLLWRSTQWFAYAFEHNLYSSALHIVLWPAYLMVPIGLALFAFGLALDFCLKVIRLVPRRDAIAT